jgi:uncharacterized coiled-coil protein SlyX
MKYIGILITAMRIPLFSKKQPPERKKSMAGRLDTEIKYTTGNHYMFFDSAQDELVRKLKPDTPEYFTWLEGLKSFHFEGKHGHFTARRDTKTNKNGTTGTYWSAYRRFNKKQHRRYLGGSEKLDIGTLEAAAQHLTNICSQEPKVKTPRRNPEKREILYARIEAREKTIAQKEQTITKLEQKVDDQEQTIRELKASIRKLEAAAKTKRERLQL